MPKNNNNSQQYLGSLQPPQKLHHPSDMLEREEEVSWNTSKGTTLKNTQENSNDNSHKNNDKTYNDRISNDKTVVSNNGLTWKARMLLWKRRYAGDTSVKVITFVALIQALLSIIFEIIVAINQGKVYTNIFNTYRYDPKMSSIIANSQALDVYYSIFCIAQISYLLLLVISIITGSIVEYIASIVVSFTLLIYSVIQAFQTQEVYNSVQSYLTQLGSSLPVMKPQHYLFGIICVLVSANTIVQSLYVKRIRNSFGWRTFRELGADLNTKKRLRFYQIYMVLLKLAAFFFLGFDLQFVFLPLRGRNETLNNNSFHLPLTTHLIIAFPISIFTIAIAYHAQKRESKTLMVITLILLQAESIYIITKIYDVLSPPVSNPDKYIGSKNSILFFEITVIILSQLMFIAGIKNYFSFGKGLMPLVERSNREAIGLEKPSRTRSYYNSKQLSPKNSTVDLPISIDLPDNKIYPR